MKYFRHRLGVISVDSIACLTGLPFQGEIEQWCVILKGAAIAGAGAANKIETPMASVMIDEEDAQRLMDVLEGLND